MPPRIPTAAACCRSTLWNSRLLIAFLTPSLQARNASILASLSDNQGAYNKRIRRGRGPSSGKGKTAGRGQKGQKSRGKINPKFQGGQTPLDITHGIRGFDNHFSEDMSPINLDRIQSWIDQRRLDPSQPITLKELVDSRCMHGIKDGVKLLARGKEQLKTPINILVSRASAEAIQQVEALGGKVTTRFYTKHSIRRLLRGQSESSFLPLTDAMQPQGADSEGPTSTMRPFKYRLPDPTSRKDMEYYRDPAHRGYLSHLLEEGHGPSLFFRTPGTRDKKKTSKKGEKSAAANRVW